MFQLKMPSPSYTHKYKNTWSQALTQYSFFTGDVISYLTVILHNILQYTRVYILYLPTKGTSHICRYWIIHLRECWVEGSSIWFYLNKTSAESTPVGSKVVKLHWRWTISWRCLFSLSLVNDELPFEMCHEFEVFLLLMCAHNFQFLSKEWLELLLKTVTEETVHILIHYSGSYVCFTFTFPYKWMFIKKNSVM